MWIILILSLDVVKSRQIHPQIFSLCLLSKFCWQEILLGVNIFFRISIENLVFAVFLCGRIKPWSSVFYFLFELVTFARWWRKLDIVHILVTDVACWLLSYMVSLSVGRIELLELCWIVSVKCSDGELTEPFIILVKLVCRILWISWLIINWLRLNKAKLFAATLYIFCQTINLPVWVSLS